jgi:Dynactin subunit p22
MAHQQDDSSTLTTLANLESRLQHLEFLLSGSTDSFGQPLPVTKAASPDDTVAARLEKLERQLHKLSDSSTPVRSVLGLQKRHPDLLNPSLQSDQELPSTLDPGATAAIVLAHASAFPETASRLTSLKDLPVPPAAKSALLVDLGPRIEEASLVQERQMKEVSELRVRSAKLLERWAELQVGMGECWAEWEERVIEAERGLRRVELRRERDEEVV